MCLIPRYRHFHHFEGTCSSHFQPEIWRDCVFPKCSYLSAILHDFTSRNILFLQDMSCSKFLTALIMKLKLFWIVVLCCLDKARHLSHVLLTGFLLGLLFDPEMEAVCSSDILGFFQITCHYNLDDCKKFSGHCYEHCRVVYCCCGLF
jgi:hypothetical protein